MKTTRSTSHRVLVLTLVLLGFGMPGSAHGGGQVAVWGDNSLRQRVLPSGLHNVKAIAAGNYYSLALQADGSVVGWGDNAYGQISPPPGLSNVTAIAAGYVHAAALLANGKVVAWGYNGNGAINVPANLAGVRAIAARSEYSLALKADGTVVAWGRNQYGQTNVPSALTEVIAISAGDGHSLALRADGAVVAWGDNYYGQTNVPAGLRDVIAVAAGYSQSYALRADGTVVGWGEGFGTQTNTLPGLSNVVAIASGFWQTLALRTDGSLCAIGSDGVEAADLPPGLSNVSAVAVGTGHAVAIVPEGPPEILEQPGATGVAFQSNIVLSVMARGFEPLSCQWSFNGNPLADSERISGVTTTSLAISNAQFSDTGTYSLLLSNALGLMPSSGSVLTVISPPVVTLNPASQTVPTGTDLTLTATAIGTPPLRYQWLLEGAPLAGATRTSLSLSNAQPDQSGKYSLLVTNVYGAVQSSNAQVTVLDSPPYILTQPGSRTVNLGGTATFSVNARGSTPLSYQWRFNGADLAEATNSTLTLTALRYDQAGYYAVAISNPFGEIVSAKAQLALIPVAIWGSPFYAPTNVPAGLTNLMAISAGDYHLLGLKSDGNLAAWGGGGIVRLPFSMIPTNIPPGLSNVAAIAAGPDYNLVLQSNGMVKAWGAAGKAPSPTNVPATLSNVVAIAAGPYHSLALKSDGRVAAWGVGGSIWDGYNYNTTVLTNVPPGLSNVTAISAGAYHNLALKQDGTVAAWGDAYASRLPGGLSNIIAVAAGDGYSLALRTDGKVVAWLSSISSPYPPIRMEYPLTNVPPTLSNVVAIAAGSEALALRADGTVVYWTGVTNGVRGDVANVFAITSGARFSAALPGTGSPHFTLQPASQTVARGATVRLHARAAGIQPLAYQWQLDGTPVPGATNGSLVLTNAQGRNAGSYCAVASNALGATTSLTAVVTIPFSTNLAAALNAGSLTWTTSGGGAAWFAQNRQTHDGEAAAQSGHVTHNQQSALQTTVSGPGLLTFWWKVSSEEYYDRLSFDVDGTSPAQAISGESDWQQVTVAIPAGPHTPRWVYSKDSTVSAGLDAGWVDQVAFTPTPPLRLTAIRLLPDGTAVFDSRDATNRDLAPEALALVEVQASTNLRDWVALPGAGAFTNGALLVRDPDCVRYPQRFYRLLER